MPILHSLKNQVCPHCKSTTDQFVLFAHACTENQQIQGGQAVMWVPSTTLRAFVSCVTCRQPSMVTLVPKQATQGNAITTDARMHERYLNRISTVDILHEGSGQSRRTYGVAPDGGGDSILHLYTVTEWYPNSAVQRPERDLVPEAINLAFDELEGVVSQPRFLVVACRRILEIAANNVIEKPKQTLSERIGQMQGAGLLTREIADWARVLKDVLNATTHDGPAPDKTLADEVYQFTRLFVELLYVYPARIEKMRSHKSAGA